MRVPSRHSRDRDARSCSVDGGPVIGGTGGSAARSDYSPPQTPWGDPDLQGIYTNADENGTPMEQPAELAGKRLEDFGEKEMAALVPIARSARRRALAASVEARKRTPAPAHRTGTST